MDWWSPAASGEWCDIEMPSDHLTATHTTPNTRLRDRYAWINWVQFSDISHSHSHPFVPNAIQFIRCGAGLCIVRCEAVVRVLLAQVHGQHIPIVFLSSGSAAANSSSQTIRYLDCVKIGCVDLAERERASKQQHNKSSMKWRQTVIWWVFHSPLNSFYLLVYLWASLSSQFPS